MRYREFAPGEEASGFVECYWVLEGAEPGSVQRVVPDGRPELILNLGAPFETLRNGTWQVQPQCFLAGQISAPLLLRATAGSHILGVRLRPGGAFQLLGMPAQELTGRTVPLDELGLKPLANMRDTAEIERTLLQRRQRRDPLMDEAVRLLSGSLDVAAVAERLGMSSRQLERRFQARVGIPPKLFARIRRFQRVFPAIEREGAGWVGAAAGCGYYDQAHLIRDFREFAGEPPAALLAGDELARHFLSHFSKTGAVRSR
uniref:Transcriptional regulator, Fis family n=1 Tax=Solibacter usitatus (strain Ellin6076) TaxID=234267 RepID=Q02C09_SOLUE